MDLLDFYEKVQSHDKIKGLGFVVKDKAAIVEYIPNKVCTMIQLDAIEDNDWDVLRDVITLKRDPEVLYHMTRVVGYYSRVENWNKSKIGELKDRQKGNYKI